MGSSSEPTGATAPTANLRCIAKTGKLTILTSNQMAIEGSGLTLAALTMNGRSADKAAKQSSTKLDLTAQEPGTNSTGPKRSG